MIAASALSETTGLVYLQKVCFSHLKSCLTFLASKRGSILNVVVGHNGILGRKPKAMPSIVILVAIKGAAVRVREGPHFLPLGIH